MTLPITFLLISVAVICLHGNPTTPAKTQSTPPEGRSSSPSDSVHKADHVTTDSPKKTPPHTKPAKPQTSFRLRATPSSNTSGGLVTPKLPSSQGSKPTIAAQPSMPPKPRTTSKSLGLKHNLRCVNDYLFTVYCSLTITPTDSPPDGYRLIFRHLFPISGPEEYVCQLRNTDGHFNCSFNATNDEDTFSEMDHFEISLCQIRQKCELLDRNYRAAKNIKPNAPCGLVWNTSQDIFSWRSGYEDVEILKNWLMYELHFYNRDHNEKLSRNTIQKAYSTSFSVNNLNFAPDTEYTVRVRSIPIPSGYNEGQWSEWSHEVYWKTQSDPSANTFIPQLDKNVIISLCVLAPLLLLLGLVPVMKTRLCTFIPTPAPYFQSLYNECQGDFKSWVLTPNNDTGLLTAETAVQVDSLIKHTQEDSASHSHQKTIQDSPYYNIPLPGSDAALLGLPYDVTLVPSTPSSVQMKPEAVVEQDSGCSFCSSSSLSSDYCTLSDTLRAFHSPDAVIEEHQPPSSISRHISNNQNEYVSMTGFISDPDA